MRVDDSPVDLGGAEVEQLAGVVPVVDRLGDVDALVALEADQLAAGHAGERLGEFGLADAGLALEQQRPAQRHRQEHRGRDPLVGEVSLRGERLSDVGRVHAPTIPLLCRVFPVVGCLVQGVGARSTPQHEIPDSPRDWRGQERA